jgi:hypothetical protein
LWPLDGGIVYNAPTLVVIAFDSLLKAGGRDGGAPAKGPI